MPVSVGIQFGGLAPLPSVQLNGQGLVVDRGHRSNIDLLDRIATSVTILHVNGYITDKTAALIRRKIVSDIGKHVSPKR